MVFDARLLTGVGVLAAVNEAGSFARAAETLGMTASGVSRAIARLEARMGIRLFDRSPRAMVLTEEGARFHARAMPLLAGLEEAAIEAAGAAVAVSGRLRANVDPWFARMVLAPRLPELMARHPLLSLELTVSNHREEMMTGMDVAVRFGPPAGASLIARKLSETRILTCAAPTYLARHGTPRSPDDLVHHEGLMFRDPQTGRPFTWEFRRGAEITTVSLEGRVIVDDPSVAVAACVAGQGVFQSLEIGLRPWLERGELVQILPEWADEEFPLYVYNPSKHLPPVKVRAFTDFAREIVAREARCAE